MPAGRRDHRRDAAGSHHRGLSAKFGLHPVDQSVQQQRRAQHAPALHTRQRIVADGSLRHRQRDIRQQRRAARQGRQRQVCPRQDGPAPERPLLIQHRHRGGGTHVDQQQWRLIQIQRAHGGGQQVRAQRLRPLDTHRYAAADVSAHHQRLFSGQQPRRALQGPGHRRHHRGDDDLLHLLPVHLRQLQQLAQCHGVIAHGVVPPRGDAEAAAHLAPLHQSHDHMGISHVQSQQHTRASRLMRWSCGQPACPGCT